MAQKIGSAVLELRTDDRSFSRGIDEAEKRAKKFDTQLKAITDTQKQLAIASAAAFTAVAGAITYALNASAGFEQQMARVRAVSQATNAEFKLLEQTARELGRTTQFTTVQAAEAMDFLAMAGFRVNEIVGAMPTVLQLAAAAQMDLARSADIVTNILTGFGLEVDQLAHANDVLVAAMTGANTDLVQLGEAMKYAGPLAQAAGVQFEEAAAALAMMGNAGIQASMAGTSLRGAITRLLNPTRQINDVLNRLGIQTRDSSGNLLSLADILEQLERRGATAGDMMIIFGQRAGPAMQALVDQGSVALRQFTERLENSGGLAERIANQQMDTLHGSALRLQSAWADLRIEIGDTFAPAARAAMDSLTELLGAVSGLDQNTRRLILTLGSGSAGFIATMAATSAAIWAATRAWQALRTGFLASMGPAGWLILGLQTVLSLAAGLRAASFAADAAFKSLLASSDLDELQRELEKINEQLEQSKQEFEPEFGGPRIRFQSEESLNNLLERREAIEKRIAEVIKEQEEAARLAAEAERLAALAAEGVGIEWENVGTAIDEASEAFKRWQKDIEKIEEDTRFITDNMRVIVWNLDAHTDQAEYIRNIEQERVLILEQEIAGLEQKIQLTERALKTAGLTEEEQERLNRQLERFNAELGATKSDLLIARETLRLAERDDAFGAIARRAASLRINLREGLAEKTKLLGAAIKLLDEVYELDDGTLQWRNSLALVRGVVREIRDEMNQIGEITAQLHVTPLPLWTRVPPGTVLGTGLGPLVQDAPTPRRIADEMIQAINVGARPDPASVLDRISNELRLLLARRDAGIVSDADVSGALIRLRSELLATIGPLRDATTEQLALYNQLSDALRDWFDDLSQLPEKTRQMIELLDAYEMQLGAGLEMERRIARATGEDFDKLAFEFNILQDTLRQMTAITGEIPDEALPLLERLGEITIELETTNTRLAMINSGLDVFARRLSAIDPALGDLMSTVKIGADGTFQGFNQAELMAQGLAFALNVLIDVIDDGSAEIERRIKRVPDPGTDVLSIAERFAAFENLDANLEERTRQLRRLQQQQQAIDERTAGGALAGAAAGAALGSAVPVIGTIIGAILGGILGGGVSKKAAVDTIGPQIQATEQEIARLEDLIHGAQVELIQALGIGADTFAAGIQRALDSVSTDQFRSNLDQAIDDVIRSAMINTFIAQTIVDDLQTISDHIQNAFLGGGSIEDIAARIDTDVIGAAKDSIEARADVLTRIFDELGLATEDATKNMRELSRTLNVPSGYKIDVARFQTALPSPIDADAFAAGGVTQIREGDTIVNFNREVYGLDDFRDVVTEIVADADRNSSMGRHGVTRGGRRRF